jgi:S1-C subfamily serine protease
VTGGLAVLTAGGEVLPVLEVLAADRAADVALLQVDTGGREVPCLPLRPGVPVGTGVWIIGHSDGNCYLFTEGMVARRVLADRGTGSAVPWVQVTAEYAHGASGAPVLDETGAVVAVVSRTDSVYYDEGQGVQRNLQMVLRFCCPTEALAGLVCPSAPDIPCVPPAGDGTPPPAPDVPQ